jgi:hypothetical protein
MATTGVHSDSDDDRETGDESTAPQGTPGYNLGSPNNPSRILPGMSPPKETSDFLHGWNGGFSPYGPANDSVRHQNIFGMTDSTRGVITTKSMLELLAQYVSKNEMREGIITRLNKPGGMVDSIRKADFGPLEATPLMTDKVRKIFENIMEKLPIKCAEIYQEVLIEIFDMIAPKICPHSSLVQQTAETSQVSPATFKLHQAWKALLPLYESLHKNKIQIETCRKNSTEMLTEVQRHEQERQENMQSNDLAFIMHV